MRRTLGACLILALASLSLTGCGGSSSLGRNSDIVVHLKRTDGTQNMTQYELYLTKSNDTTLDTLDLEDFVSSQNAPSWSDNYASNRSTTELNISYTTRSDQTPYYVWVKVPNTGAAFETLNLQIDVDGVDGPAVAYDLTINTTQRLVGVRVDRNEATY
ncbi:MAG: hypothetical protein JST30_12760 [Armatimonadetes bacterium]|nr:hypothetical protein [Armatimonadota bacterium]